MQSSTANDGARWAVRVIAQGETLARQTGLLDQRRRPVRGLPNRLTTGSRAEVAGLWRGAFLAAGTLSEPGRSAALEITCPAPEAAMALVNRIKSTVGSYTLQARSPFGAKTDTLCVYRFAEGDTNILVQKTARDVATRASKPMALLAHVARALLSPSAFAARHSRAGSVRSGGSSHPA